MSLKMVVFFEREEAQFQDPTTDEHVDLDALLISSRELLGLIDGLGRAFQLIRNDIEGNIKVLEKVQERRHFGTVHSMLESELQEEATKEKNSGTIAMLWLKRALQFIHLLNRELMAEYKSSKCPESMGPAIRKAYEGTLRKYHGWITQKLFSALSRAVPWKKDFFKAISKDATEAQVMETMEIYNAKLGTSLNCVQKSFNHLGLDFPDRV